MEPSITVLLFSYNQSEYLLDSVNSVINQTTDDWELIVIDNGSTDGSQKLLKRFEPNPKVKIVLHPKNRNLTINCNQGVNLARGKYISFLYSDDYYLPEKLEKQLEAFSKLSDDYGVIHSPCKELKVDTGRITMMPCIPVTGEVLGDLFTRYNEGFINPITPLIRKECFERYPFYEDQFTEGEGIFFRFAMTYKFYYMTSPTAVMREHGNNMRYAKKNNAVIFECTINRLYENDDFPIKYQSHLKLLKARILASYGWQDIRLGTDTSWARSMFKKAVKTDWRQAYKARTIIGWGLSLFLVSVRVIVNKIVDKILNRKHIPYTDKY